MRQQHEIPECYVEGFVAGVHQRRQGRRGPDRGTAVARVPLSEALSAAACLTQLRRDIRQAAHFPLGSICCEWRYARRVRILLLVNALPWIVDKIRRPAKTGAGTDIGQPRTGTGIMNPVKALEQHGQSVWLDFLARGF